MSSRRVPENPRPRPRAMDDVPVARRSCERAGQIGRPRGRRCGGRRVQAADHAIEMRVAGAGRHHCRRTVREQHQADAVAVASEQLRRSLPRARSPDSASDTRAVPQSTEPLTSTTSHTSTAPFACASRTYGVFERAVRLPVDASHVVARLVLAHRGELDSGSEQRRALVAVGSMRQRLDERPAQAAQEGARALPLRLHARLPAPVVARDGARGWRSIDRFGGHSARNALVREDESMAQHLGREVGNVAWPGRTSDRARTRARGRRRSG